MATVAPLARLTVPPVTVRLVMGLVLLMIHQAAGDGGIAERCQRSDRDMALPEMLAVVTVVRTVQGGRAAGERGRANRAGVEVVERHQAAGDVQRSRGTRCKALRCRRSARRDC